MNTDNSASNITSNRVLIVDDDENILKGIRRFFHREPYELFFACSSEEALDFLEKIKVNVVVSDETMSGLSGTEFFSIIKSRHPDIMRIMLTGNANMNLAIDAINSGEIYRFLTKPCSAAELGISIRQALQQQLSASHAQKLLNSIEGKSRPKQSSYKGSSEPQAKKGNSCNIVVLEDESIDLDEILTELDNKS